MSVRTRAALVATVALCLAAPAAASANSITTGHAESNGRESSNLFASASTTCDGKVSFQWGTSADNLSNTRTHPLTTHPPGNDAIDDIGPLTAGATYYYRAEFTAPCGNAEGAIRCFVHSEHPTDPENAACPNDPGEPSSGGGGGGGGGDTGGGDAGGGGDTSGGSSQPTSRTIHVKGHRCVVPVKIGYVFRLKTQGGLKCGKVMKILDGKKARNQIGRKRVVTIGGFKCVAVNRNHGSADYHCKHGGKGWFMRTYGAGDWRVPGETVFVDY
jgi:hypothetical protein